MKRYFTKANNTWQDDIEVYVHDKDTPITSLDVYERKKVRFTGLYDEIGQEIYTDNRQTIGFKL